MKIALTALALLALTVVAACGDDDDASTATPSVSPTATAAKTATPVVTPTAAVSPAITVIPQLTPFADVANQVNQAVKDQDAAFFSDIGVETSVSCVGNEDLGPCSGQAAGTVISGIPGAAWHSDAFGYTSKSAYNTLMAQWFAAALPQQSDSYGDGTPRLAAVAGDSVHGDYYAIVTEILDTGPATGIQRQARAFRFAPDVSGQFNLTGEILAAVSFTSDEWLQGGCTICYYDSFQLWP